MRNPVWLALFAGVMGATPALAGWPTEPFSTELGHLEFSLGAGASGALFAGDEDGAAGQLRLTPKLSRSYDSGMVIALEASILPVHDPLLLNRYGNEVFEQVFASLQMGLGRVEIGQVDGAGYRLAVTGPKLDPLVSLDDPQTSFFRDPATGRSMLAVFAPRSQVGASANFAKLSYYSPRLFGAQIGLSYTPSQGKNIVPFLDKGPDVPNRQNRLWEMAANYEHQLGTAKLTVHGALTMGHNEWRIPGYEGLTDWGFGAQVEMPLGEDWQFAAGGAYRRSNAYGFDIIRAEAQRNSGALHLSTALFHGDWGLGFEFTDGTARSVSAPDFNMRGYQAGLSYRLTQNFQLTTGWQQLDYRREFGTFYNGAPRITLNAGFLHLRFKG